MMFGDPVVGGMLCNREQGFDYNVSVLPNIIS